MEVSLLEIRNFMSFSKATIHVEGTGVILIQGRNGVGKSTIWDALSWCIFGQTVRGLSGDNVVHRDAGSDCFVSATFIASGKSFTVYRYRGDAEFDDRMFYIRDGSRIESGTRDATQSCLLEDIGIDFELFRCTVLFAQGEMFDFVSATDKKQKEILSKVKRVNFSELLTITRQRLKDIESAKAEIETKLAVLRSHLVENPEASFKGESEVWEAGKQSVISDNQESIAKAQGRITALQGKIIDTSKVRKAMSNLEVYRKSVTDAQKKARDRRDAVLKGIGFLNGRISEIAGTVGKSSCPVCLQKIDAGGLDKHLAEMKHQLKLDGVQLAEMSSEIDDLSNELSTYAPKAEKLTTIISEQSAIAKSISELTLDIEESQKIIAEWRAMVNPLKAKIEEAVAKQIKIANKIASFNVETAKMLESVPFYRFWETGFSDKGMKSFIFDSICSTLTAKANHYLGIMSDSLIAITFDTQTILKSGETRERFECAVVIDGVKAPLESFSGGEKTRISLAVDMALSDIMSDSYATKFNLVVFDEQDQFLDSKGREHYFNLLKERAKTQRVFVVSHDSELNAKFSDIWTVEKVDGCSQIRC